MALNMAQQLMETTYLQNISEAAKGLFGAASEAVKLKNEVALQALRGESSGNLPQYTGNGSAYDSIINELKNRTQSAITQTAQQVQTVQQVSTPVMNAMQAMTEPLTNAYGFPASEVSEASFKLDDKTIATVGGLIFLLMVFRLITGVFFSRE